MPYSDGSGEGCYYSSVRSGKEGNGDVITLKANYE